MHRNCTAVPGRARAGLGAGLRAPVVFGDPSRALPGMVRSPLLPGLQLEVPRESR